MTKDEIDFERDTPIAVFESDALPDWKWEVYEVTKRAANVITSPGQAAGEPEEAPTALYFGRVKSPLSFGTWEAGSFSAWQLRLVRAERVDGETDTWP